MVADFLRSDLIDRHSELNVRAASFPRLRASKKGGVRAGMIAGTVTICPRLVVGQAAEHEQVLTVFRERLKDMRKLIILPLPLHVPFFLDHPIGYVDERHARGEFGIARRQRARRDHRLQGGQRDGCTEPAQKSSPWNLHISHLLVGRNVLENGSKNKRENHFPASPRFLSNGKLVTMPSTKSLNL